MTQTTVQLSRLLERSSVSTSLRSTRPPEEYSVETLTDDSRQIAPRTLYCCTPQGEPFLESALERGCRMVLIGEQQFEAFAPSRREEWERKGILFLLAKDLLEAQGHLASALYDHPSRRLHLVGITGTNGKTSTAWMMYHIWSSLGIRGATVGTLGVRWRSSSPNSFSTGEEVVLQTGYTTPRAPQLHSLLARMEREGVTHVALEVSSEALSLGRLEGSRFSTAVFLNLTPDHLDFHGSMEEYFRSKMRLLEMTARQGGRLIVYADSPFGEEAARRAEALAPERSVVVREPFVERLPEPTGFHRINASLAVLAALPDSSRREEALLSLESLPPVPGRFNLIFPPGRDPSEARKELPSRFGIVDYAHTPDALENLLRETRRMGVRTLVTVFGCGGDRDRGKRPLMGEIAARYSDSVIVTDDNPRSEDPAEIRREILQGAEGGKCEEVEEQEGRRSAIDRGVRRILASTGLPAALVVAGKGHETVQIFKDHREEFSDTLELQRALRDAFPPSDG